MVGSQRWNLKGVNMGFCCTGRPTDFCLGGLSKHASASAPAPSHHYKDTVPCKVTRAILHGTASPEARISISTCQLFGTALISISMLVGTEGARAW